MTLLVLHCTCASISLYFQVFCVYNGSGVLKGFIGSPGKKGTEYVRDTVENRFELWWEQAHGENVAHANLGRWEAGGRLASPSIVPKRGVSTPSPNRAKFVVPQAEARMLSVNHSKPNVKRAARHIHTCPPTRPTQNEIENTTKEVTPWGEQTIANHGAQT